MKLNRKHIWLVVSLVVLLAGAAGIAGTPQCVSACQHTFNDARKVCDRDEACLQAAREALEFCKEACH